jgi:UDP-2,4-diacetamido-2,4,6-trideoxy-beta-L-altropyranose hydrolase
MSAGARVAFVTEGSAEVGLGHVSRCLALARAVGAEGARSILVAPADPRVASLAAHPPAAFVTWPWPDNPLGATDFLRALGAEAIVVDSYKASPDFLGGLHGAAPVVVAIDDLADRPLPVDVVVNGSAAAESLPYRRVEGTRFLLGSRYALLDPDYAGVPERVADARVSRIFVSLGGGRWAREVAAAIRAADAVLDGGIVDVAAGPFSADAPEIDDAAGAARNHVVVHRDRFGLRELMAAADVAVCGAGMTLYELSAVGTPAVVVQMSDNQGPNAEVFSLANAAVAAGAVEEPGLGGAIAAALRRLADPDARAGVAARARALVDGRGAGRVARQILHPAMARSAR